MRPPPPLTQIIRYPISGGLCLLAIGVTLAWMTGHSIQAFTMSGIHFVDQPWRMFTAVFPHVNLFHLAFNVYWVWVFGTLIERELGALRFALIALVLAAGSGAAEMAVLQGGVGLSGVGYGLFGLLWVLSKRDARFFGAIDSHTTNTFVGWFFLCIVLTAMNIMPVANVAHGMGAVLGAGIGWIIVTRGQRRKSAVATFLATMGVIFLCATVLRPEVNFSQNSSMEYVNTACDYLRQDKPREALPLLEKAVQFRRDDGYGWYNMGVAYDQLHDPDKALLCYQNAVLFGPTDETFRKALQDRRQQP